MPLTSAVGVADAITVHWAFEYACAEVWRAITDPALIGQWLGRCEHCDLRIGGNLVVDHGEGYRSVSSILEAQAPHPRALSAAYRVGWMTHFSYLEAAVEGSPLPTSHFWNLNATLQAATTATSVHE